MLCALCFKNEQRLHRWIKIAQPYLILFSRVTRLRLFEYLSTGPQTVLELIIKRVHNIHFGTRDSSTYVIFAIGINGSSILSF